MITIKISSIKFIKYLVLIGLRASGFNKAIILIIFNTFKNKIFQNDTKN